ncbi:cyclic nucleotide-binding domain-containing thioredoxin-disulfide reductase [Herbiconiux sp. VKM Ac-2851]|uniref:FAD-dependent oxidoreductase n=1 Tax=Herbiconiux sp. VKM Ac-2851 TaxID=2739025 RepID=UPI001566B72B|nr:cyclic nucleotide-binding domain-containing thioredoxin-disulfide reductase [Herbiconiux sp. VKM Ac-2851]NQX37153.1 FAD-dependent oxidoreductase [Herbiconiux sp. VKM Ac-2851]
MNRDAHDRLTPDQFGRLAVYGVREHVSPGQVLSRSGDHRYDLFLVESCSIDVVCDATGTDTERVISTRSAGDFTGELGMLTGQSVFLTLRVDEPGTAVRIDAANFRRALSEQSDVADILVREFGRRRQAIIELVSSVAQIVGVSDCADHRALRTFAARHQLAHTTVDADSIAGQALMAERGLTISDLPVAIVTDRMLKHATPHDLASAIGLTYSPGDHDVDLVVIGAGPAGLAAAVYAASEGLVTVLFDASGAGGQAATSSKIENYLGFPGGVSGSDLAQNAALQALKFGAQLYSPCQIVGITASPPGAAGRTVTLADGTTLRARAAIVATGAQYRRLDVPRRDHFERRTQIRYSATELDARDCHSQPVTVVGGANSAGQAALFLASKGSRVDLVVRASALETRMSQYLARRINAHELITVWVEAEVVGLCGLDSLAAVVIRSRNGSTKTRESRIVFCLVGAVPDTEWLTDLARDESGFILTDTRLPHRSGHDETLPFQTSDRRVFAVGDVRAGSMKRVASAVGEGASAVSSVHALLATEREMAR